MESICLEPKRGSHIITIGPKYIYLNITTWTLGDMPFRKLPNGALGLSQAGPIPRGSHVVLRDSEGAQKAPKPSGHSALGFRV